MFNDLIKSDSIREIKYSQIWGDLKESLKQRTTSTIGLPFLLKFFTAFRFAFNLTVNNT